MPNLTRKTSRRNRPYTEDHFTAMRLLAEAGFSRPSIARVLDRPVGSVSGECSRFGIRTTGHPHENRRR